MAEFFEASDVRDYRAEFRIDAHAFIQLPSADFALPQLQLKKQNVT